MHQSSSRVELYHAESRQFMALATTCFSSDSRQNTAKDAKAIPLDVALSTGLSTPSWFDAELVARRTVLRG
jgi:hypothetical protein